MRITTLILVLLLLCLSLSFASGMSSKGTSVSTRTFISNDSAKEWWMIEGIDWDEWLESTNLTLKDWFRIEGIDWDEWLENIGLKSGDAVPC